MSKTYIGVDPGKSGAIVFLRDGEWWAVRNNETAKDIHEFLVASRAGVTCMAMVEVVHSSPQMGVKSAFTFGESFGMLKALLTAHSIPYDLVRPQAWQKAMGCMTKGDKNVSKRKAQELFPNGDKITHATADALLLAEYARRRNL